MLYRSLKIVREISPKVQSHLERTDLYLSILFWFHFAFAIFGGSSALFTFELYFRLVVFVVVDTQEIIEKAHLGNIDYVKSILQGTLAAGLATLIHIKTIILWNISLTGIIPKGITELMELLEVWTWDVIIAVDLFPQIRQQFVTNDPNHHNEHLGSLSPVTYEFQMLSETQVDEIIYIMLLKHLAKKDNKSTYDSSVKVEGKTVKAQIWDSAGQERY
ncbi:bax inhibitor 1-like protein [Corchorus olitorius]|uniref:Bax inhibitor 1-like protein n=1 Tax=Corchorus olitorius TaxID=93759 RepID=A0A1R3JEK7_9ROSI|nr:bax inhibitor 1-like protein [Corchorus olitorius]